MATEMTIQLLEVDADPELVELLAQQLRTEILDAPVDSVTTPTLTDAPEGSRAIGVVGLGALIVTMKSSAALIGQVVEIIRSWRSRKPGERSIKLVVGDNVLELSNATEDQQQLLVDRFVGAVCSE